ncbi:UDP-N-acetylmuramoyl-tripeptide--D-alanyl-D-alanine ligase [Nocardioidaceae bacterium]|nr:UDP-N-acetylmuramoyl-tripeptide--D-alanyl-D-alanine ligase [Nocardioidaceae bacterium]
MTLGAIADATRGTVVPADATDLVVDGPVDVDSRRLGAGGLFVAVAGERVDGHDFADAAAERGAVAALGSRPLDLPTVVVPDPVVALGDLAREVLARRRAGTQPIRVLALTGSAGKTSTKDLMAAVLADPDPGPDHAASAVVATAGNFNNEIGVPLTVLRLTDRTSHLVLEMGARGIGHIAMLCRIARPDVAAVLNVGSAHLGEFGSREAIAQAKGEIVEALPPAEQQGVAVLAADDVRVAAMAPRTRARVLTFGRDAAADVRAVDERVDDVGRVSFTLTHGAESAEVALRGPGRHQVLNALAAAAAALAVSVPVPEVAARLSEARGGSPWRMEVTDVDGITVVNDAYNANPESMRAALDVLGGLGGRRAVAVLGAMGELGDDAPTAHAEVGAYAVPRVAALVVVGPQARQIAEGAREAVARGAGDCEVVEVPDHAAALHWLRTELRDDDVLLAKGSRSAGMEVVALDLVEHGWRGAPQAPGHGRAAEDDA